ncbi:MAG: ATP-binding cassette domain-containing protein [Acidobacteria bacterium]|jgi:osmoprotectant transport system ATP-binding protein|nr:ATP-binding cassette domain-containing protein [Acidobacteriota bacterium]
MIEIQSLSKRYGDLVAVDDLSLNVDDGELLVLLGGSGSGKTTTLKMVNRLIEPTAGRVMIDGQDVGGVPLHELRRRIGYVFQRVGLFPHMSVGENIAIPLTLIGWPPPRIQQRVDELLELVELSPGVSSDRRPSELSGGQKQRVGVARALAAAPHVMLLDEPFGALDPLTRDRLQQSFLNIRRQLKLTAIFVTHDMAEALLVGDRIGIMRDGKLIQIGTPRDLLHAPVDDYVRQLIETPMRQARIVDALLEDTSA